MRSLRFQLGQFFLAVGVIMLAIFFVTLEGNDPQFLLFFGGAIVAGGGISLMVNARKGLSGESARFRSVRRYRQKQRERQEKKRQRQQERRER